MPFTPFHMGPALLLKALLQGCFSLTIFGWAQIVMDIQPLIVMVTGEGKLHGSSHTLIGATVLLFVAALTGRGILIGFQKIIRLREPYRLELPWSIVFFSAAIGTYSHVFIDMIMHGDVHVLWPFSTWNGILQVVSTEQLHWVCIGTGGVGIILYTVLFTVKRQRAEVNCSQTRGGDVL